jgi:hypothetical protein
MSPGTTLPSTRSLPPTTQTSNPTPAYLDRFISCIASAFNTNAVSTAFISEIDATPPPYPPLAPWPITHARSIAHFAGGIRDSVSNPPSRSAQNAILLESGDWAAVASWEPPSYTGPPFSESKPNPGPLLSEWRAAVARTKMQYLDYTQNDDEPTERTTRKPKPHYHLAFLARVPGREDVKGAISAAMLPFLAKARDEGVPVWLEATDPHAVAVYEHYGFRVCEVLTVGVGRVGADGWPKEGGEGIKWWGMLWDGKSV